VFGSNHPIEKLWSSHGELYRRAPALLAEADRTPIFFGTGCRFYRLD
jgi:predicted TIM-barrel fold metal-dependent hydrolase